MPCYPAFALLLGAAISNSRGEWASRMAGAVALLAALACLIVL